MANTTVAAGVTRTTRLDMAGTDTLTVQATGIINVSANAQAVRFNGPTNGASIQNDGTIQDSANGGRAIRFETSVGATLNATITNSSTGTISGVDDAIQIQAGIVTAGKVTINNAAGGSITSATGQAIDFAGGLGTFIAEINNSGTIAGLVNDAFRIGDTGAGGVGNVTNHGMINGGSAGANSGKVDGVKFGDNTSGVVRNFNDLGGSITADRHAISAGLNSNITVYNGDATHGGVITGRNGSGVGSDGSATVVNYGTITGGFTPGSDVNGHTPGAADGGGPDGIDDGDGDGIDIDFLANIENFGTIQGIGASGNGSDGLPNTSEGIAAGGGTFINHIGAIIEGLGLGMLIDNSSQGNAPFVTHITNDGTILGSTSYGICIISALDDTIDNSGTILGGNGTAIQFGSGNNTLKIRNGSSTTGISTGGAGTDTLDYSAYTASGVNVNLATGAATGTGGVSAFETVLGSALADTFRGSGAAEFFDGGDGVDTAVFSGEWRDYAIAASGAKFTLTDTRAGSPDGTNTFTHVENFQFSNGTISAAQLLAPAQGDANGDGRSDILWQNTDGTAAIWAMKGTGLIAGANVGLNPGAAWHVIGSGDFNGDRKADILWQNNDGTIAEWFMNGTTLINGANVGFNPGPAWHAIGSGDFNGDGKADILWQNADGTPAVWLMDGLNILSGANVGSNPGAAWHVIGAGDFNGDGKADILWQNNDGTIAEWFMNGTTLINGANVGFNPGAAWHAVGAGDFNGDGKADILWQNADGTPAVWLMNGTGIISANVGDNPGSAWHALNTGDYNGDGKADILWQNNDGTAAVWLMNGTSVINGANVGSNPGNNWHVIPQHHDMFG